MATYILLKQVAPVPYEHFADRGYEVVGKVDSFVQPDISMRETAGQTVTVRARKEGRK